MNIPVPFLSQGIMVSLIIRWPHTCQVIRVYLVHNQDAYPFMWTVGNVVSKSVQINLDFGNCGS